MINYFLSTYFKVRKDKFQLEANENKVIFPIQIHDTQGPHPCTMNFHHRRVPADFNMLISLIQIFYDLLRASRKG